MDRRVIGKVLRENWYLAVLCFLFLGMGVYGFHTESDAPKTPNKAFKVKRYVQPGRLIEQERPDRLTRQEQARAVIAGHEQKINEGNMSDDDIAAYMNAIGNLHMQKLGEYKEAAEQFELLLSKYPNWSGTSGVYTKLALCYERLDDDVQAQQVYMRMRSAFPPDSQEYQFATQELGLQD